MRQRWTLALLSSLWIVGCADPDAPPQKEPPPPEALAGLEAPSVDASSAPGANAPTAATSAAPARAGAPRCPPDLRCDFDAFARAPSPRVDRILIRKAAHVLYLQSADGVVFRGYTVAIGYGGAGPKRREGDGVTPVGDYTLTSRLATSPWHTLIGVSYPNLEDQRRFVASKAAGEIPWDATIGSGIALHGHGTGQLDGEHKREDWTLGCVALDTAEIDEVAALAPNSTKVRIED